MNEHASQDDNNNPMNGETTNFLTGIIDIITNLPNSKCTIIEKQIILIDCIKKLLNASFSREVLRLLGPLLKEITFEQVNLLNQLTSKYLSIIWCRWIDGMEESTILVEITGMFLSKIKKDHYHHHHHSAWWIILSHICVYCKVGSNFILDFIRSTGKIDQPEIVNQVLEGFGPILTTDTISKLKDLLAKPKMKYLNLIKYAIDTNSFTCFDRKLWRKYILKHWSPDYTPILTRLMFSSLEIVNVLQDLSVYQKKPIYQEHLENVISYLISLIWSEDDIEVIFISWLSSAFPLSESLSLSSSMTLATTTTTTTSSSLGRIERGGEAMKKWIPKSNSYYFMIGSALATRLWPKISLLDRIPEEFHEGFFFKSISLVTSLDREIIELVVKHPKSIELLKKAIKIDPLQSIELTDFVFDLIKKDLYSTSPHSHSHSQSHSLPSSPFFSQNTTTGLIEIFSIILGNAISLSLSSESGNEITNGNNNFLNEKKEIKPFIVLKLRENLNKFWPLFPFAPQEDVLFSHLEKQMTDKVKFFVGLQTLSTIVSSSYMGIYIGFLRTAIQCSWSLPDRHIAILVLKLSLQIEELTVNHSDEMVRFIIQLLCDKILVYYYTNSNNDKNNGDYEKSNSNNNLIFEEAIKWLERHFFTIPINMQKVYFSQLCLYHHSMDPITSVKLIKALLNSILKHGAHHYSAEERSFILEATQQLDQGPLNSTNQIIQHEAVECLGLISRFGSFKFRQEFLNKIMSEALGGSISQVSKIPFIMAIGQCCVDDSVFPILVSLLKNHEEGEFRTSTIISMIDCLKRGYGLSFNLKSQLEIPFLLILNGDFNFCLLKFTRILLEVRGPEIIQDTESINLMSLIVSLIIDNLKRDAISHIKHELSNSAHHHNYNHGDGDGINKDNNSNDNSNIDSSISNESNNDRYLKKKEEAIRLVTVWMILSKRAITIPNLQIIDQDYIKDYLRWFIEFSTDSGPILSVLHDIMKVYNPSWRQIVCELYRRTESNDIWMLFLEKCLAYSNNKEDDFTINNFQAIELLVDLVQDPKEYIRILLNILKPFTEGINRTNYQRLLEFGPKIMNRLINFFHYHHDDNESDHDPSSRYYMMPSLNNSSFINGLRYSEDASHGSIIDDHEPQIITILNSGVNLLEDPFLLSVVRLWILASRPSNNWNIAHNPRLLKLVERSKSKMDKIEFLVEFSQDVNLISNFLKIHNIKERVRSELYRLGRLMVEFKPIMDYEIVKKLCISFILWLNANSNNDNDNDKGDDGSGNGNNGNKKPTTKYDPSDEQLVKIIMAFSIFKKNDCKILLNVLQNKKMIMKLIDFNDEYENDIMNFVKSCNPANMDLFRVLMLIGSEKAISYLPIVIYNILMMKRPDYCKEVLKALSVTAIENGKEREGERERENPKMTLMTREKMVDEKSITWPLIILLLDQSKITTNQEVLGIIKNLISYIENNDQVNQLLAILPTNIAIQALTIIITKTNITDLENYFIDLSMANDSNHCKSLIEDCLYILREKKPVSYQKISLSLSSSLSASKK